MSTSIQFMLDIDFPSPPVRINYRDAILATGSCFTEHIGDRLLELKFDLVQNPQGILFDPASVAESLVASIQQKPVRAADLFFYQELWHSWQHHSRFSHPDQAVCLDHINSAREAAHQQLRKARWLIITLGTSFSYRLLNEAPANVKQGMGTAGEVANCHRAPAQWFRKYLMSIEEINAVFDNAIHQLFSFNPQLEIIFTVSPVRHIRDGVIENNRSKARLIEVVQQLVQKFNRIHYFPAYELVIDVLRDYRFYDIDLVHPNYQATRYVLEQFERHFIDEESQGIMQELSKLVIAHHHRPLQPDSLAHRNFLRTQWQRTQALKERYPFLHLDEELAYFANGMA